MSTPVITSRWAGNFDCTVCRRKRLMADEFSKSSLDKHRKTGQALQCKPCVAKQEQEKRMEAARNKDNSNNNDNNNDDDDDNNEKRTCALCNQLLSKDSYNRNQWSKPEGKSRCRSCVEKSIKEDENQQLNNKDGKIDDARKKLEELKLSKTATAREIVAAESVVAAFEAEKVTGLKPIRMGGRGRGRGRGGSKRSSGRGGGRGGGRGSGRGTTTSTTR
jgi:hypothetical protein